MLRLLATIALLGLLPALQGCITLPKGMLTNRVTVTLALDECQSSSRWAGLSLASDVDERDCTAILRAIKLSMALGEMAAAAAQEAEAAPASGQPATGSRGR